MGLERSCWLAQWTELWEEDVENMGDKSKVPIAGHTLSNPTKKSLLSSCNSCFSLWGVVEGGETIAIKIIEGTWVWRLEWTRCQIELAFGQKTPLRRNAIRRRRESDSIMETTDFQALKVIDLKCNWVDIFARYYGNLWQLITTTHCQWLIGAEVASRSSSFLSLSARIWAATKCIFIFHS